MCAVLQLDHPTVRQIGDVVVMKDGEIDLGSFFACFTDVREVASGGFATVYFARAVDDGSEVALKVLKPDCRGDPKAQRGIASEWQMLKLLENVPHVVRAHNAQPPHDYALVQQRAAGLNFAKFGKECGSYQLVAAAGVQVLDALVGAHAQGIVHRDIKPDNVLVGDGPQATVLDWGLAVSMDDSAEFPRVCGSPLWMSPEQCEGERLDGRSDVYSLGCTLYEV